MTDNIKMPPYPEGLCLREDIEDYASEAVRLNAQAVPDGMVLVDRVALNRWRDAFAEELSAWDIDPPLHHVKTSHDEIEALLSAAPAAPAAPQPRDDGMPASSDERHLRRLLAARVAMPNTYFDDGEAHGTEHGIQIDFMREPVAHIDAKLRALNVARLAVAAPQPAQQPLTDEQKAIMLECRNQAMRWTLEARIPETGAFGGIAQDLDYLCGQLGVKP